MQKQALLIALGGVMALGASTLALGQNGFYGGVSMRDNGAESSGLKLGDVPLAWNRFTAPVSDDTTQRSLLFGGYRWQNDIAVEGAVSTSDKYSLHPGATTSAVASSGGLALTDASARSWNADVYTSWEVVRSVSLYGRLGYVQNDARQLTFAGASLLPSDPRRQLAGVNYGLGVRYDVTHSLGLRAEYSRFGRFAGEGLGSGLPESDQLTVGVQYRF